MNGKKHIVALDYGNSSYRLVLGTYEDEKFEIEVIAQEKNGMVKMKDYYYWDIVKMYNFLISNLKKCVQKGIQIDSIGICTWGVDFAFFDKEGFGLGDALSYRNTIGQKILDGITNKDREKLFYSTGIYCDRINSVYMMSALQKVMPTRTEAAEHVLMVPDIFNYLLTGEMINEPSELSTTQLMSSVSKEIDSYACDFFDIPKKWFSKIGQHGEAIGNLLDSIKVEIGVTEDIPIICVPSHDTASAVAAIPTEEEEFLFISTGTWALIGVELDKPIINEEVLEYGLTNEVGAFGKITLLKNSTGMFILEKIKSEYEEANSLTITWDELLSKTEEVSNDYIIDVNEQRFFNPLNMTKEIQLVINEIDTNSEVSIGKLLGTVQRSMAVNYAKILKKLEAVTHKKFDKVYMVGGGMRNKRINELTASISGKNVITCGEESTCLGNLGVQLKYFDSKLKLKDIRKIIGNSVKLEIYDGRKKSL